MENTINTEFADPFASGPTDKLFLLFKFLKTMK